MRKRLFLIVLLVLVVGTGWIVSRALHQAELDHDLIAAVRIANPQQVKMLLAQGADANTHADAGQGSLWQSLLNRLLHRKPTEEPGSPLKYAVMSPPLGPSHLEIARLLLEHHADPNIHLWNGMTAIQQASMIEDKALLNLLLDHGANPNTTDNTGSSLLMGALMMGHAASIPILLAHGADPNRANADGDTALLWAAEQAEPSAFAQLLAHKADARHQNKQGQTALTFALAGADPTERIGKLLEAGADANLPDAEGGTPFLYALAMNSPAAALMLAKGGNVHHAFSRPATSTGNLLNLQMRVENASSMRGFGLNIPLGATPLMLAARTRDVSLVKAVLAKGAKIDARDAAGKTALAYADPNAEIMALLRKAGARP